MEIVCRPANLTQITRVCGTRSPLFQSSLISLPFPPFSNYLFMMKYTTSKHYTLSLKEKKVFFSLFVMLDEFRDVPLLATSEAQGTVHNGRTFVK